MSYPGPRYFGDSGEASASFRAHDQTPDLSYPSGGTVDYLATGDGTAGELGLYRWNFGPDESGPDAHFHRTISESFYVLSGSVRLYDGERWIDGIPGDYVYIPEGGIHGFRNESGEPSSMLILFAPGAPREGYFEGIPMLAQMSDEEKAAFFLQHDNHWL